MNENGKLPLGANSRIANSKALKSVIDSALERKSSMSITLPESTIGVSLDTRGDWTISIGLSLKSSCFHSKSTKLEGIGFFQATENDGTSYFLWTSFITNAENGRTATEQVLAEAVKILQALPVSQYIS
jgi:hypothetical protein